MARGGFSALSLVTLLFFASLVILPLFIVGDRAAQTLDLAPLDRAAFTDRAVAYFSDAAMLAGFGCLAAALLLARLLRPTDVSAASASEGAEDLSLGAGADDGHSASSLWYLLNGAFIHVTMDGLTGGYHLGPLMDANYRQLDNRCNDDVPVAQGGPHPDAVATALVVFRVELFLMAPLCLLTYLACRGCGGGLRWLREELELVTLTFQLCGTIWFVVPEILTGCVNMHPIGNPAGGGCLAGHDGSAYDIMYFWFAVGANAVWVLVPLVMLRSAAARGAARKESLRALLTSQRLGGSAKKAN